MEDTAGADAAPGFFDPSVEICQMSSILGSAGEFHGHQGVVAATLELVRECSDPSFIPEEIRTVSDQVAVVALFRATARRSGAPMEMKVGHLFTLHDGLIVRFQVFENLPPPFAPRHRPARRWWYGLSCLRAGIRSSGKLIKMVDHAHGWQVVEQIRLRVGCLSMTWAT